MVQPWDWPVLQPLVETLEFRTDVLAAREGEQRIALRPRPREILTLRHRVDAAGYAAMIAVVRANLAGAWLVPDWARFASGVTPASRTAQMTQPLSVSRERSGRSLVTATFTLAPGDHVPASPCPVHLGLDVLTDRTVVRRPLSEQMTQAMEIVDNGFGPLALEPGVSVVRHRQTIATVDRGTAARDARRLWLMGLRGRQRAFWLPTWGRELVLATAAASGATTLAVAPVGTAAAAIGRSIMIDIDGAPQFRTVTGATIVGGVLVLTVAALSAAVPLGTRIHWLTKVRLDADRLELLIDNTRTEFNAPVVEVPA